MTRGTCRYRPRPQGRCAQTARTRIKRLDPVRPAVDERHRGKLRGVRIICDAARPHSAIQRGRTVQLYAVLSGRTVSHAACRGTRAAARAVLRLRRLSADHLYEQWQHRLYSGPESADGAEIRLSSELVAVRGSRAR